MKKLASLARLGALLLLALTLGCLVVPYDGYWGPRYYHEGWDGRHYHHWRGPR